MRRRLAFALALVVSGCAQLLSLVEAEAFAAVLRSQNQSAARSKERASQNNRQSEDKSFTRSRRAEPATDVVQYASPNGPIIRVALMTNVTTVTLGCSSGLMVNRGSFDEGKRVLGGSLRVELSQQSDPVAPAGSTVAAHRVLVRHSYDSRVARNLAAELKKKFFEPVTMTFDENQNEYAVLIGQCPNRSEAAQLLERLRKAGYEGLRIVSDPKTDGSLARESVTGANPRTAKYKAQPGSSAGRPIQMVAFAADKITASSADELIVVPAESTSTANRTKQNAVSSGDDERSKRDKRDQKADRKEVNAQHGTALPPPAVRVGSRDYRGEIHLVLNARALINVVNVLPLEDYLRGVVPMELSPGAYPEIEALKAQAVAARSYALERLGKHRDEGFDLVDDTRDQVYGGRSSERELTNRAVDETRGIVAVFPNEDGKLAPIEALYTANCGGRTENNEEVFGGKGLAYLRSVACAPDRQSLTGRDIVTSRTREPLVGVDGRSITREVALLFVLGFSLPRRLTSYYLGGPPDQDEVKIWITQTARLAQKEKPLARGDVTRLAEFARLVAASIYGEGRASTLLAPADVDYLLAGIRVEQLPGEARTDVAMLLRDGILRLPADAALDGRATITRVQAIETLARAMTLKSVADLKSQISNLKFQLPNLQFEIAAPSEKGRLIVPTPASTGSSTASRSQAPRFTGVNTSGAGRLERTQTHEGREATSAKETTKDVAPTKITLQNGSQHGSQGALQTEGLDIAEGAWIFRSVGGESYAVDRLTLIGGERVTYHLNATGQVDFLEASVSERSASSDRFSSVAQWRERVNVEELRQRLARARVNVGRLETIAPVAFSSSSRVTEVEITGDEGHTRLRRPQIRTALGLKEYLFVVDRETDSRGRVVAFVFTGRGWGHGVGMCQTGAYGLAKDGYSYTAILQKYYTGIKLQRMY